MRLQLYLHFPFCKRKCFYCDFCSAPGTEAAMLAYCRALGRELLLAGQAWPEAVVSTVYFGGGTPSIVPARGMALVLNALHQAFRLEPGVEFSSEANPGTLTEDWLEAVMKGGLNRLSLGVQAAQDRLLRSLGRIHTFQQAQEAFAMAKKAGIKNLNADLMFGLPGQSPADYRESLQAINALEPAHLSAYSLIVEEHTPLYRRVQAGQLTVPDDDAAADCYQRGLETLAGLGYRQYEISNFAKPGFECRHNIGYWQGAWYLGLGLNAHSMLPPAEAEAAQGALRVRKANTDDLNVYMEALEAGRPAPAQRQSIGEKEAMFETMMLGLRMNAGVLNQTFEATFARSVRQVYGSRLDALQKDGLGLWTKEGGFRLTPRGLLLQNEALLRLMEDRA